MSHVTRAAQMQHVAYDAETVTGRTSLGIPEQFSRVLVDVSVAQNVDTFDTRWYQGREIIIMVSPGSAATMTIRENQAGTNIVLASGAVTIALNAADIIRFVAEYDSSGNEMWYQSGPLVNHT